MPNVTMLEARQGRLPTLNGSPERPLLGSDRGRHALESHGVDVVLGSYRFSAPTLGYARTPANYIFTATDARRGGA